MWIVLTLELYHVLKEVFISHLAAQGSISQLLAFLLKKATYYGKL